MHGLTTNYLPFATSRRSTVVAKAGGKAAPPAAATSAPTSSGLLGSNLVFSFSSHFGGFNSGSSSSSASNPNLSNLSGAGGSSGSLSSQQSLQHTDFASKSSNSNTQILTKVAMSDIGTVPAANEAGGANTNASIVKEGWLQKRGEHIKTWRSRYFILRTDGTLHGWRNKPNENGPPERPLNDFTIKGCQIMTVDRPRPFTFIIRGLQWTSVVERTFSVDTERERQEWTDAIRYVCEIYKKQVHVEFVLLSPSLVFSELLPAV